MLFHVFAFADILAAGADGEPAAVPADIGQHLGGGFGIDLPDKGLIVVFLFLQPEILHGLAVVPLDLFLRVAQVGAQLVGAAGTEGVGGEGELDLRPGHLLYKGCSRIQMEYWYLCYRSLLSHCLVCGV